jgi:hypothetical protein
LRAFCARLRNFLQKKLPKWRLASIAGLRILSWMAQQRWMADVTAGWILGAGGWPHDAADELHFDDFLFVFPTHQPLTFSTHERGLIPQICGVVVNKVFARERARVLHEH